MNRLDDLMPNFWDNDFEPLSCGIIEIWADATCTRLLKLYSGTAAGDNELRNPYHLTSAGRPLTPVYFEENGAFVVVKDKDGVEIKSYEYEISSVLQGGLSVKEDIEAGRNLASKEDTKVGRNLAVEKDAIVKGDISANNAAIANKTATTDLIVSNHAKTKTLEVTEKADIKALDVTGSFAVNEAKLNSIEIAKSMKFGALNVFIGQTFADEPIISVATYIRCTFAKPLTLGGNISNVRFIRCVFNEDVNLTAGSYSSLHIEECTFKSGKKISLANPACAFSLCKIRRNESEGGGITPINLTDGTAKLAKVSGPSYTNAYANADVKTVYNVETNFIHCNFTVGNIENIISIGVANPSYAFSVYDYHAEKDAVNAPRDRMSVTVEIPASKIVARGSSSNAFYTPLKGGQGNITFTIESTRKQDATYYEGSEGG